ncbi:MAG: hypothetical protein HY770_00175 [Chitinivibrionia bacterium]|nr:hypothetical protein [Chitinivibrionia bacterium]
MIEASIEAATAAPTMSSPILPAPARNIVHRKFENPSVLSPAANTSPVPSAQCRAYVKLMNASSGIHLMNSI